MVVGVYPLFVFPAMKLSPLVLGPGIRARSGIPDILKFTCRWAVRVARLCGRSLGRTDSRVSGPLIVIVKFLFQGRGQSNQNLVVVSTLLVPLAHRLIVRVKVYHIGDEGAGVEG